VVPRRPEGKKKNNKLQLATEDKKTRGQERVNGQPYFKNQKPGRQVTKRKKREENYNAGGLN